MRRAALLLTAISLPAWAASPAYERCAAAIDPNAMTNSQRLACATTDMDRADGALNDFYRQTMARLPPARRNDLRIEERRWIEQRTLRCALERQAANPSRDLNRMLCLIEATDARTEALKAIP